MYAPQIRWTGNDVEQHGVKILAYGRSGVGKTRLAASCPAPLVLSAEKGLLSLRRENLPYIEIKSLEAFKDVYQWLLTSYEAKANVGTVVIDSASDIAETVLFDAKLKNKDPRKAYGEVIDVMVAGIRAYRDLPGKHVLVICKEEWQKDELTGMSTFGPMLPGSKLGPQLPYFFDEVFRFLAGTDPQTKQPWSALQTQADAQSVAKDRSGMLQPFEVPHIGSIINKIYGYA